MIGDSSRPILIRRPSVGARVLSKARRVYERVFSSRSVAPASTLYYATWHTADTRVTKLRSVGRFTAERIP